MARLLNMKEEVERIREKYRFDGGQGSGNWGHEGRPGERGGSGGGGGAANRYLDKATGKYTSFAKAKEGLSKPHQTNATELKSMPAGAKLIVNGETYTKLSIGGGTKWANDKTGEQIGSYTLNKTAAWEQSVKIAIPKSAEAEFMEGKGEKGASIQPPKASGDVFNENGYDEKRVSDATIFHGTETLDNYKGVTEACWATLDKDSKEALYSYTTGSRYVNEPLHGDEYKSYKGRDTVNDINKITAAIDKCEIPKDTIMFHGVDASGAKEMLGIDGNITASALKERLGQSFVDEGFVSCGAGEGKGFQHQEVLMNIFVPQGAKGIYSDQFSHYGNGSSSPNWNGKTTQKSVSQEDEIILQRGGSYRLTSYEKKGSKWHLNFELVGQDTNRVDMDKVAKLGEKH